MTFSLMQSLSALLYLTKTLSTHHLLLPISLEPTLPTNPVTLGLVSMVVML